jgi:hypothetical protein
MRRNIPSLPIQIDARFRPLRTFRISVRVMMLVVVITALFFSLLAHHGQLVRANNYHANQAFNPLLPDVIDRHWHAKMYDQYHAAVLKNEMRLNIFVIIVLFLAMVAIIGRVMNSSGRRSEVPEQR